MMALLQRMAMGIAAMGALFLLCGPVLYFILRPQDDVFYHLFQPEVRELQRMTLPEHNEFVTAQGTIAPDSFAARYVPSGFLQRDLEFKFRLKEHSPYLFVYLDQGPLYDQLVAAVSEADEDEAAEAPPAEPGDEIVRELDKLFIREAEIDLTTPAAVALLAQPIVVEGRIYQSDFGLLDSFGSFAKYEDAGLDGYIQSKLQGDVTRDRYSMVAGGEVPSLSRFWDGNTPVFLFGCVLGFFGLSAVIGVRLLVWASSDDDEEKSKPYALAETDYVEAQLIDEPNDADVVGHGSLGDGRAEVGAVERNEPVLEINRQRLEQLVLEHLRDRSADWQSWLITGVLGSLIAFFVGMALTFTIAGAAAGLRMIWIAVSLGAFRREGGRELRKRPESFHPFFAFVVIPGWKLDDETSERALLIGSFEDETAVPPQRLIELTERAQHTYLRAKCERRVDPEDAELAEILTDVYRENRRRRLPNSLAGGASIYFFDAMIRASETRTLGVANHAVLPCLAQPGDSGELIKLPWKVVQPAILAIA